MVCWQGSGARTGRADAQTGGVRLRLTVATFNLRTCRGGDGENGWERRVDQVAQTFRLLGATIVGTQEGHPEMLADLASRLPEFRWFGASRLGDRPDEYCAIFYRPAEIELTTGGHFWLAETPTLPASRGWDSSLPRMCTWARCSLGPTGPAITVYNTHLDHVGEQARLEGIRQIVRTLQATRAEDGLPAVLMGDFNAGPGAAPVRFLREESGLRDAYGADAEIGRTYHGFRGEEGGAPIDYIFTTPDLACADTRVWRERVDGRYPSDHYPVLTHLRRP